MLRKEAHLHLVADSTAALFPDHLRLVQLGLDIRDVRGPFEGVVTKACWHKGLLGEHLLEARSDRRLRRSLVLDHAHGLGAWDRSQEFLLIVPDARGAALVVALLLLHVASVRWTEKLIKVQV